MARPNRIFVFLTLLLLFSTFVYADKETIINIQSEGGLDIAYPPILHHTQNSEFNYTFAVHNSSGFLQTDPECNFSLTNKNNYFLISNQPMSVTSDGYQYILINDSVTSIIGEYDYYMYCITDNEAGFLESVFIVTRTGNYENVDGFHWFSIFFSLTMLSLIMIYASSLIKTEPYEWLKIFLYIQGVLFILLQPLFVVAMIYNPNNLMALDGVNMGLFSILTILIFYYIVMLGLTRILGVLNQTDKDE